MPRATEDGYDGIPYEELSIETVDWEHRAEYIRTRSARKGPKEFDIEPEWATEAVHDPRALVGAGPSESGVTIQIIGYSRGAGRLLSVLILGKDEPVASDWWGVNAWGANDRDKRAYAETN